MEWLDTLISVTLNPNKIYFSEISKDDAQVLSEKVVLETLHIQSELRNQAFALHKESQVRLLVRRYHSAFIILLDTITDHQRNEAFKKSELTNLTITIISCLNELLFFLENRFGNFLSLEERAPSIYLEVSRSELKQKLDRLKNRLITEVADARFTDILLGNLYAFSNSKKTDSITLREVLYRKELVKELELLSDSKNQTSIYTALNELLVYMNFNNRSYVNYFTTSIADKINLLQSKIERIDSLRFHYKEFKQMYCNKDVILDPHHPNLKDILSNWFIQEIAYLEKTLHIEVNPIKELRKPPAEHQQRKKKILCNLSSDQIAIILRAADESRLIKARSMSEVFKNIVPHLSTPRKQDLSYDSVRTKSYSAEISDKEVAMAALHELIKKIDSY
jgi:hypothetical protein